MKPLKKSQFIKDYMMNDNKELQQQIIISLLGNLLKQPK